MEKVSKFYEFVSIHECFHPLTLKYSRKVTGESQTFSRKQCLRGEYTNIQYLTAIVITCNYEVMWMKTKTHH